MSTEASSLFDRHTVLDRPRAPVVPFVERLVRDNLGTLVEPGQVVELRALDVVYQGRKRKALSGYYDDLDALARDAASLDGRARGIYWTLNPLRPETLHRSPNRLTPGIKGASDCDVLRRRWLPVDLDPVRPAGTSSTDVEIAVARERAEAIWLEARRHGWDDPLVGMSGNGWHLLFLCDLPADDPLVKRTLQELASRFSDDRVAVDRAVFNPARIWRLYGTLAMKGPASDDRPHRRTVLLSRGWHPC